MAVVGYLLGRWLETSGLFVSLRAADALAAWLQVRGDDLGPLFCRMNKGGKVIVRRIHTDHASVTTTARYERRDEEAKRKVVGFLHVPYRKGKVRPERERNREKSRKA